MFWVGTVSRVFAVLAHNEQGLAKWLRLYSSDPNQYNCWALYLVENIGEATILPNPLLVFVFFLCCGASFEFKKCNKYGKWIRVNEDDVYDNDEIVQWQYAVPNIPAGTEGRMLSDEQVRDLMMFAWKSAANAFRLYPGNKHTFSNFWESAGEKYSKDFKL